MGSNEKMVVRVTYSLAGDPTQVENWQFRHSPGGGWRYQYDSSVLSYCLNVM